MATLNKAILEDAFRDGMLKPQASISYLHASVNTANGILLALKQAGDSGLDVAQLTHRSGVSPESVKIFSRELARMGLIRVKSKGQGSKNIYFLQIETCCLQVGC